MAKNKLVKHHLFKSWYLALGSIFIAFILGSMLLLPIWDKRSGFEVLMNSLSDYKDVTGDEYVEPIPYIYVPSTRMGGISHWVVNETFYRSWLNNTIIWKVEKGIQKDKDIVWSDYKGFTVDKIWDETTLSEKHTVTVNSDEDAYYRILTNTKSTSDIISYDDYSVKEEIVKTNDYLLTFKITDEHNYNLVYNWDDYLVSDIASKSSFTKDVKIDSVTSKDVFEWTVTSNVKISKDEKFVLDPTYGLISDAVVNSWEYDAQEGKYPDMVKLGSDGTYSYYVVVSTGDSGSENDGYLRTVKVWENNGTISTALIDYFEYDTSYGTCPSIINVGTNMYAVLYAGTGASLSTQLFTIGIDTVGNIDAAKTDTLQLLATGAVGHKKIIHITGNVYAGVYSDSLTDLWLTTFNITSAGIIDATVADTQEIDGSDGIYPDMCLVDSGTVAVVYDSGTTGTNDGYMSTWNITSTGVITNTYADFWEFDTSKGGTPTIAKISGTIYMVAYEDTNSDLYVKTCTIADTGDITASWIDTQAIDTTNGDYPTFFDVCSTTATDWVKGISFSGEGSDGYVSTFDVNSTGFIGSEIDTLEIASADTIGWYAPICFVSDNYFIVVHEDGSSDGWAKTFEINTNIPPVVSNPSPANNSVSVAVIPQLSVDIADIGDYYLNSSWYSNSSGTWQKFGDNSTIGYGAIKNSVINSWEYDAQEGDDPDAIKLGSDGTYSYFAIVSQGDTGTENDGYIRTIKVWENNGTIYPALVDSYEYDTSDGICPNIVKVSGDVYAICYYDDTANKETVKTVSISSVGDIDTVTGVIDTLLLSYDAFSIPSDMIQVTGNVYAVVYVNASTYLDSILETVWINNTGTINNTVLDTQVITTTDYGYMKACSVDSNTIAICNSPTGSFRIYTYNVSSSGIITNTASDSWTLSDTATSTSGDIIKISGNVFAIAYKRAANTGVTVSTLTIANTGMITKSYIGSATGLILASPAELSFCSLGNSLYSVTTDVSTSYNTISVFQIADTGIIHFKPLDEEAGLFGSLIYYYLPTLPVANDFYLVVYEGDGNDGWVATVLIENSTNTTIYQTNSNFSAYSTKYWWSVNTTDGEQWTNQTFSFTTEAGAPSEQWNTISDYNGTIYNQSSWHQLYDYNGSIWNGSAWHTINNYNGSIFNQSSYNTVNDFNGTVFNQSSWNTLVDYNGTVYNVSLPVWLNVTIDTTKDEYYVSDNYINITNISSTQILGNSTILTGYNTWIGDLIRGQANLTLTTGDGYADNISVRLKYTTADVDFNISCAIYRSSDNTLVGNCTPRQLNLGDTYAWYTFDFPNPKPLLLNNTEYNIVAWADTPGTGRVYVSGTSLISDTLVEIEPYVYTGVFPNPMSGELGFGYFDAARLSLYCSYTTIKSMINNTGMDDETGYLLMRLDYNNSGVWTTVEETINETSPRIINSGTYLMLDTLWNGNVTISNLTSGPGMYRIYTAFRYSNWSVIKNYDSSLVEGYCIFNYIGKTWNNIIDFNGTVFNQSSWVNLVDYNGTIYNSSVYSWNIISDYNGTIYNASESNPPTILINRAGNITTDYVNDSYQLENWIYINCTVTDDVDIAFVRLNWSADDIWDNSTYTLSNTVGDYYEINMTSLISNIYYTFNIYAEDVNFNGVEKIWLKKAINDDYERKYVRLNGTSSSIEYIPYYVVDGPDYTFFDNSDPILQHEQKVDAGGAAIPTKDSGYLLADIPTDIIEELTCGGFMLNWLDETTTINLTQITNAYYHYWWTTTDTLAGNNITLYKGTSASSGSYDIKVPITSANSHSDLNNGTATHYLNTQIISWTGTPIVTDNTLYQLRVALTSTSASPYLISNRSYTSFILFNVPDNATLNASAESDSDGLSDWEELYQTYTNPFLDDTDNDSINDYWENLASSDPNNYTESFNVSYGWHILSNYNGTIYNSSNWNNIIDFNGTIYNSSVYMWNIISDINGTIWNQSHWKNINDFNGSIFNSSSWYNLIDYNGTIYNISTDVWKTINDYNGIIFNQSSYNTVNDFNGTVFNTSNWHIIDLWDSVHRNGSIYNKSLWNIVSDYNGIIWNGSSWYNLVDYNGTIYNSTDEWVIIIDYNGSIYNSSGYYIITNYNGTIYNVSSWHDIADFNGTIFNVSIEWINIIDYNGTIWNGSSWYNIINWNGSIYNISLEWINIIDYNGTIYNITSANIITNWNGTIYNHTIVYLWVVNPYPSNNSNNANLQPYIYATFMTLTGSPINVTWYYGNSTVNTTTVFGTSTNLVNETDSSVLIFANSYGSRYYWRVQMQDAMGHSVNETLNFKTKIKHEAGIGTHRLYNFILIAVAVALCMGILLLGFVRRRKRNENDFE